MFLAALTGIGGFLAIGDTALQPALAEGYDPGRGAGAPVHREAWLSDGYWLDGAAGGWVPAHQFPASQSERYRPQAAGPAAGGSPPRPLEFPSYRSDPSTDKAYHRDLRPTYTSYGRPMSAGWGEAPFAGDGFRPLEPAPETGWPAADAFGEPSFDPYAGPRSGGDAYSFRPEFEPQVPERVSPVWYRERGSGKRYLFRPVSQDELVARPSDHSFNSPRYAQPESGKPRYPGPDRFAPSQGGAYGQPRLPYSNARGWGGDFYGGGPIYGFE
jgi:hypothetical protein